MAKILYNDHEKDDQWYHALDGERINFLELELRLVAPYSCKYTKEVIVELNNIFPESKLIPGRYNIATREEVKKINERCLYMANASKLEYAIILFPVPEPGGPSQFTVIFNFYNKKSNINSP